MKKIFSLLLVLAMILTAGMALAEEHENVTLKVWIVQTDFQDAWYDSIEPKFESEYPWIDLEVVGLGVDNTTFITTAIQKEDYPDVWQVDNTEIYYSAVDSGLLRDLNELEVSKDIPEAYRDAFTYNGKLFGLTQGAAFSVLYLNMQILEEAGWTEAPQNWDAFIQCCADVQEKTGIAPLTLAGSKTTTNWMLYELIIANVCGDELGMGVYEEQFMSGTFDFSAYPAATERLAQVAPYMLTGTASMTEDDVTAAMADGAAAMCIAGNWTSNNICSAIEDLTGDAKYVKAILAPFNDEGKDRWISNSPETAFGLSATEVSADHQEAREIFFNWIFQPENFKFIQNARGTVPVLTTMTADDIILPAAIAEIVPDMNASKFVKMGFNLWTQEFKDAANTALRDVYGGNKTAEEAVQIMTESLAASHVN